MGRGALKRRCQDHRDEAEEAEGDDVWICGARSGEGGKREGVGQRRGCVGVGEGVQKVITVNCVKVS